MNPDKTSHDNSAVAPELYTGLVTRACLYFYWDADLFVDIFITKATGGMMKIIITYSCKAHFLTKTHSVLQLQHLQWQNTQPPQMH